MMNFVLIIGGMAVSYLLGTISTAYILVRLIKGKDIREFGSGNAGATNALRVLGKIPGFIVLVLDILKGVIAVTLIAGFIGQRADISIEIIKSLFGLSAVCGHVFNVFLGFKGGKGVATGAGVLISLNPLSVLWGVIVFIVIVAWSKYVSLGSIVCSILIPFFMLIMHSPYPYTVLAALLCIIIVAKHKANINRLLTGRERKVFSKK